MDWFDLPFVPEPKEFYGIPLIPDHVYVVAPPSFVDGILRLWQNTDQFTNQYELVELEIPPGFAVEIPVEPYKTWQHRWLGWRNRGTGEIPFEIHTREFRREDLARPSGLPIGLVQHHGWRVETIHDLSVIEGAARELGREVSLPLEDRGDGVSRIYVTETFHDPGKLEINEYLWKPPGFKQKILEKEGTS